MRHPLLLLLCLALPLCGQSLPFPGPGGVGTAAVSTDYANTLGTGDRRPSINVFWTSGFVTVQDSSVIVDGSYTNEGSGQEFYIPTGTDISGKSIWFDFRSGRIVDQIRVTLQSAQTMGTWQVSGSNNASSWTDIDTPKAFTTGSTTITLTFSNSTSYRFLRITGVSDYGTQTNWREVEFKIAEGNSTYNSPTSFANALSTGDRTATITLSADSGLFANTTYSVFVNGIGDNTNYVPSGTDFIGKALTIDFGSAKILDAIKLFTELSQDQGAWTISGSNDGSSYTTIATAVTSEPLNPKVWVFFNLTAYRYYRMTGASGTVSQTWWREMEFRIN